MEICISIKTHRANGYETKLKHTFWAFFQPVVDSMLFYICFPLVKHNFSTTRSLIFSIIFHSSEMQQVCATSGKTHSCIFPWRNQWNSWLHTQNTNYMAYTFIQYNTFDYKLKCRLCTLPPSLNFIKSMRVNENLLWHCKTPHSSRPCSWQSPLACPPSLLTFPCPKTSVLLLALCRTVGVSVRALGCQMSVLTASVSSGDIRSVWYS